MKNKLFIAIIAFIGVFVVGQAVWASYPSTSVPTKTARYDMYEFFASTTAPTTVATTTTATSTNITPYFTTSGKYDQGYFVVAGAKKISMYFGRGDTTGQGNAGSSLFKIQVSADGSTWVDYNKLIDNVTNTNSQTLTRVASKTISAATSTVQVSLDPTDSIYAVRCVVVETTDGEHRCFASAEW